MNRKSLIDIRPNIPSISQEGISSEIETFQNKILRPILKFQNDLLLEVFRNYIDKRKGIFRKLEVDKKKTYISDNIKKDIKLKHLFLGVILAHFTLEEWQVYAFDEKELNKRITNMLVQRLQDQIELI